MTDKSISHICKYKECFDKQNIPIMIIDFKTGAIDDVNLAACNYYSYSKEELTSMNIADLNILSKEAVFKQMSEVKSKGSMFFRFKHKSSNGEIKDVEVYSSYFEIGDRELLSSMIHDVKEKSELEKAYLKTRISFDSLFNNSPEAIAIVDRDFRISNTNDKFKNLFQYSLMEIENQDITKLLCGENSYDSSYSLRSSVAKGRFISQEVKRQRKDGSKLDVLLMGFHLLMDDEITGAYFIYTDISESKKQESKIRSLTYRDFITGLSNRKYFFEELEKEIIKKKSNLNFKEKIAVIILDVNEYKEINYVLGSLTADLILKEFALRLRHSVGDGSLIARFINDKFVIMLPFLKEVNEIRVLVDKIIKSLDDPFSINIKELQITTNIGISIYPDDGMDPITLMRKAEIAMDESKKISENKATQYKNSYDKIIQENFWIKNDLLKSIDKEEILLNYQPIYNLCNNKLVGLEALARWKHKEKGIISPLKFIPMAEKNGMIHPIGEWVLRQACKQNKSWQDLGYEPIWISVNISVLQLENPNFVSMVKRVLKDTMLDPKYLQLEITETYFTQDYELIKDAINELSKLGVKFAIDDFGTGYSSLGQLSELSISTLKIDRVFIDYMDENINNSKIVKAIISLANSLGISLIAEGVERLEELSFLKKNMCNMVQGYLFSKPVSGCEFEKLLELEL